MSQQYDPSRSRRVAFIAGGVGFAGWIAGAFMSRDDAAHAYLIAYLFWIAIAVGSLAFLMLHQMVGGLWGFTVQRILESAAGTIPAMAVLFIPIALLLKHNYPWADPDIAAHDHLIHKKAHYLNAPFFIGRAAFYLGVWSLLAIVARKWSRILDERADAGVVDKLEKLGGPAILLWAFTETFAAFDWGMSTEPWWFSAIYGVMLMVGQGLSALCFAIIIAARVRHVPEVAKIASPQRFQDLGNLTFAFVILWAYMHFSQYLIIWQVNLPEEIVWYLNRTAAGEWRPVAYLLVALHFAVPFFLLLVRDFKRRAETLRWIVGMLLVMRYVEIYWLIEPSFSDGKLHFSIFHPIALVAIGGVWLALFFGGLLKRPLVPMLDPRIPLAVAGDHELSHLEGHEEGHTHAPGVPASGGSHA